MADLPRPSLGFDTLLAIGFKTRGGDVVIEWWQALMTSIAGGTSVAVINAFLGRRKRDAEIRLIDSQVEKTRAEARSILSEIGELREAQASISEGVSRAADSAEEAAAAALISIGPTPESTRVAAQLREVLAQSKASNSNADVGELVEQGLVRRDSAGNVYPTSLGRRFLATRR